MIKPINVSGVNGVFTGQVLVVFSATTRTRKVNNPFTHDEEDRRFSVHRVTGSVSGKSIPALETEDEDKVPDLAAQMEKQVTELLKSLADHVKKPTAQEILEGRGYL